MQPLERQQLLDLRELFRSESWAIVKERLREMKEAIRDGLSVEKDQIELFRLQGSARTLDAVLQVEEDMVAMARAVEALDEQPPEVATLRKGSQSWH